MFFKSVTSFLCFLSRLKRESNQILNKFFMFFKSVTSFLCFLCFLSRLKRESNQIRYKFFMFFKSVTNLFLNLLQTCFSSLFNSSHKLIFQICHKLVFHPSLIVLTNLFSNPEIFFIFPDLIFLSRFNLFLNNVKSMWNLFRDF